MNLAGFPVPPVVKSVTIRVNPARAFDLFTRDLARWWPLARFHAGSDAVDCAIEPRAGGRVLERTADGRETEWGKVLAYEPPHRLAFSWMIGVAPDQAQLIEVRFMPDHHGTRVELTHSGWEKLGEAATRYRDMYDGGWVIVLEQCFARFADADHN